MTPVLVLDRQETDITCSDAPHMKCRLEEKVLQDSVICIRITFRIISASQDIPPSVISYRIWITKPHVWKLSELHVWGHPIGVQDPNACTEPIWGWHFILLNLPKIHKFVKMELVTIFRYFFWFSCAAWVLQHVSGQMKSHHSRRFCNSEVSSNEDHRSCDQSISLFSYSSSTDIPSRAVQLRHLELGTSNFQRESYWYP